jgi:ubiquinone/menaquinone biosynthesis C-methylase UbiE
MHERRFHRGPEALREPERVTRLHIPQVVALALEDLQARSVLDVGTGSGLFAEAFAGQGLEVSGVDVNPEMLAAAQSFVPMGRFKLGTAETLPFEDASADLVFMGLVFHETDDPLLALQETRRVARLRVAMLEWPYVEAEFGPPLAHRVPEERVLELAGQAGLNPAAPVSLPGLVVYRFAIS